MRAKYGWGRVRIARELGISPNTVADWINRFKMPVKTEEQYENGIFMHYHKCEADNRRGEGKG